MSGVDPLADLFEDFQETPSTPVKASSVRSWVGDTSVKRKRAKPQRSAKARLAAKAQVVELIESGEWGGLVDPGLLVALYVWCHTQVYGIEPAELGDGSEWFYAERHAAKCLVDQFAGDMAECVTFVRWVWAREDSREKWRRDNNNSGSRISWQWMFNARLWTEYRLDLARRGESLG